MALNNLDCADVKQLLSHLVYNVYD